VKAVALPPVCWQRPPGWLQLGQAQALHCCLQALLPLWVLPLVRWVPIPCWSQHLKQLVPVQPLVLLRWLWQAQAPPRQPALVPVRFRNQQKRSALQQPVQAHCLSLMKHFVRQGLVQQPVRVPLQPELGPHQACQRYQPRQPQQALGQGLQMSWMPLVLAPVQPQVAAVAVAAVVGAVAEAVESPQCVA
jgi:hypothetical protein